MLLVPLSVGSFFLENDQNASHVVAAETTYTKKQKELKLAH